MEKNPAFWPITLISGAAIFFNGLLIPIIIYKSVKIVGVYKFLLLSLTIISLAQSVCEFFCVPILFVNSIGGFHMSSSARFGVVVGRILTPVYSIGFVLWTLILTYSFIFRCMVLRGKEDILFSPERRRILIIFTILVGMLYAVLDYTLPPEEEMLMKIGDHIYNITGERIEDLTCIGGIFFKKDGSYGRGFFVWMAYMSLILPSLICCIYCTYKFYSSKCIVRISRSTKSLQNRLVALLILQTLMPLFFTYVPALSCYFMAISSSDVSDEIQLSLSTLLPVAQLIDPIIIFIFVREYHSFLLCSSKRQSGVASVSSGVS